MTASPRPPAKDAGRSSSGEEGQEGQERYEFADAHKESFRPLAASMSFVGVCTMLFGMLSSVFFVGALYAGLASLALGTAVTSALSLVIAWWTVSAGRSLSALVATRGRDVEHLMQAVAQLRRLFGLARVIIVLIAFVAVGGGAVIVWCTFVVEKGGKCIALPW
jgi:hypothetical protein